MRLVLLIGQSIASVVFVVSTLQLYAVHWDPAPPRAVSRLPLLALVAMLMFAVAGTVMG